MGTSKRETVDIKKLAPGPGTYDLKLNLGGPAFGIRGRSDAEQKPVVNVPGPGQYSPNAELVAARLTHPYSFGNRSGSVEMPKEITKSMAPGPGNYAVLEAAVVTRRKSPSPVFGHEIRPGVEIKTMVKNPGPGSYKASNLVKPESPRVKYAFIIKLKI